MSCFIKVEKVKERMQKSDQDRQRKQDIERSQFSAKCFAIFNLLATNNDIQNDFLEERNNAVVYILDLIKFLMHFL